MSTHKSNFGAFGGNVPADINGYVPTADTGPWELTYDHGGEQTHDAAGELTDYGQWWVDDRFPEIKAAAVKATEEAETRLREWAREWAQ